jgi:hypothetical protein
MCGAWKKVACHCEFIILSGKVQRRSVMKKRIVLLVLLFAVAAGAYSLAHGKKAAAQKATTPAKPAASAAPAAPVQEPAKEPNEVTQTAVIGPQADRFLRQMSDYLMASKQLSFHAEIAYDDLLPSGQKLQLGASHDVLVRRPDRTYAEFQGERGGKRFWYDGKTITLYDVTHDFYATEQAPSTIDGMLDHIMNVYGFSPPLSDLIYSDPYAVLTQNVQYGFYAGTVQVDGERCHHLAFQEKKIDWQIWIEDGTQCVPRKVVITYKTLPGAPQFTAVLSHWDLAAPAPDGMFTANLPPGADRIRFQPSAAPEKKGKGGTQ